MAKFVKNIFAVVIFYLLFICIEARNKSPLLDEDSTKTINKAAECVFGKQVKELGSQWIPDLGVPIGVLYCMKCECVPFQRKRRIVARVQCHSIKNECPEPTCAEPVLLPGRCCKSCPGDSYNLEVVQDIIPQNSVEEEEKNTKHFAALLTGRSSLVLKNDYTKFTPDLKKNNVVATGRFTFHKKNLYYSFYISEKAARPRSLQFLDAEGSILEEFTLSHIGGHVNSVYQNATRKVCGVWKRLARDYRRLLKNERMYVVLVWGIKEQAEYTLSGQVKKYVALNTEQFSSLLEPAPGTDSVMEGAGGTAIVSISTTVSPSIHIAIIFNGLFTPDESHNVPINITLSLDERKVNILEEVKLVEKVSSELNVIEVSSPMTPAHLRHLTRGRLLLTISSTTKSEALRLSGSVITKVTCELFQSTITSTSSDNLNPNGVSGIAWMYLNNAGSLIYNMKIENLRTPFDITLMDVSTKRKTEIEDLTPNYQNGWVNGSLEKLSPKILEPLYSGNLEVNVATQIAKTSIHGKLIPKPVADARDSSAPVLLKRENYTLPASVAGLAWVSVDNDCHFHYDVSISGLKGNKKFDLYLEMYPMIAPGAPYINKHLQEFQGNQIEGSPVDTLSKEEMNRLDSGVSFLKVKDLETRVVYLTATITKVTVPATCRSLFTDNNIPTICDNPDVVPMGECFYEDKFYAEETSWVSSKDPCKMCFCQNGVYKCDTMSCPEINCPNGNMTTIPGDCCPVCSEASNYRETNMKKCIFNGQNYSPGSKFHPFLIPNGFDLCTICTCDPTYLEIKCTRLNDNEKSCCRNCNKTDENLRNPLNDDQVPVMLSSMPKSPPKKELQSKSPETILREGGCKNLHNPTKPYLNGTKYHPYIESLGEYNCVSCKCLNGNPICQRERCDVNKCKTFIYRKRHNLPITNQLCCSISDCNKKLRHRKSHKHNITS